MSRAKKSKGVMVFIEFRRDHIRRGSIQLIGEGRRIADILGVKLSGALLGHGVKKYAKEAIQYGLDKVHLVEHPILASYAASPYSKVMVELVEKYKPEIMLLAATKNGRELGGRFYVHLQTGLAADCTAFRVSKGKNLVMIRPAFGGKSLAHIMCKKTRPQMATARPNVFTEPERDPKRKGRIIKENVKLGPEDVDAKMVQFIAHMEDEATRLADADVIVAGGHGIRKADTFGTLQELADVLGGTVGGSRKVVDLRWLSKDRQVGQTGKTVRPNVYVAIGISGAVQHLAGMQESEKIVAINNDPEAEIFKIADFGIVGDLFEIVPEMIRQIKERRPAKEPT
ncbi:MAG: electron transfer flavoprotein subunit alpha/FixB family protein [Thermoplasmata archaeon]|nr:electron transfer flavoprotein subunit alpha/FixB family protein [Thermoplasmata archaeon]